MISSKTDAIGAPCPAFSMTRRDVAPVRAMLRGTTVSAAGQHIEVSTAALGYDAVTRGPSLSDRRQLSHLHRNSKIEGGLARSINPNRPFSADVSATTQGALSGVRAWRPPV